MILLNGDQILHKRKILQIQVYAIRFKTFVGIKRKKSPAIPIVSTVPSTVQSVFGFLPEFNQYSIAGLYNLKGSGIADISLTSCLSQLLVNFSLGGLNLKI